METPSADDLAHYQRIRATKARRLDQLDLQAALFGPTEVPAHIEVERAELRQEIQTLDSVIGAPLRLDLSEILGTRGRFVAYHEQNRQIRQEMREGMARLEERLSAFVAEYRTGRMRRDVMLVVIMVVVVIMAMVLVFWIGRISDGRALVRDLLALIGARQ